MEEKIKVLITGAFGTIGGEFVRQFLEMGWEVVGVDNNEWATAQYLEHPKLEKRLGDFADPYNIRGFYDLLIHCAAYKHIELVEMNQLESKINNVDKTISLYHNVFAKKKLFISTDKAVEPSSYYGETKMQGELITKNVGGIVARLGNVKNSTGSVIPKWEDAISKGEPIKITDIRMTRYMIPVDKAVERIINLLPIAQSGQVIIPAMGKPVKLLDLLESFLKTKKKPLNYPRQIIGRRLGEKLHEKLKWLSEETIHKDKYGEIIQ